MYSIIRVQYNITTQRHPNPYALVTNPYLIPHFNNMFE